MLYQGKAVKKNPLEAIKTQKKLNVIDSFKDDIKSEEIPKPEGNEVGDASFQGLGFNIFENETKQSRDRKTRYGYFREMANTELINRAIEIVADDATQFGESGDVIEVISTDENVKQKINDVFERLDFNNELWNVVFETVKMGDNFYEIVVDDYKNLKKLFN